MGQNHVNPQAEQEWQHFREAMPIHQGWTYFDHAAVSPLPQPTADAISRWLQEATFAGDTVWLEWSAAVERTRHLAAEMINAKSEAIALVPSTTFGLNIIARGLDWQAGDNVVIPDNEFPSNAYAWLSLQELGVETRRIPVTNGRLEIEQLINACDGRTRLIAASWVGYVSGWRVDVGELCRAAHANGVPVMLDAIQGLGVFPLDVIATEVDFVAADGHKWMLGPEGAGLLYIRPDWLPRLRSNMAGWNSVVQRYDFSSIDWQPRSEAARFEGGSQNMCGMIGLGASLQLLKDCGVTSQTSPVAERVLALTQFAKEKLLARGVEMISPAEPPHDSGILTFRIPGVDPLEFRRRCMMEKIALSVRGGGVRISPHAYNTEDEIEQLAALIN